MPYENGRVKSKKLYLFKGEVIIVNGFGKGVNGCQEEGDEQLNGGAGFSGQSLKSGSVEG